MRVYLWCVCVTVRMVVCVCVCVFFNNGDQSVVICGFGVYFINTSVCVCVCERVCLCVSTHVHACSRVLILLLRRAVFGSQRPGKVPAVWVLLPGFLETFSWNPNTTVQ